MDSKTATDVDSLVSENLICPFEIKIPKNTLVKIQNFVNKIFALRCSENYQVALAPQFAQHRLVPKKNFSLFMSYDFHLRENGAPALIEINTNAAFAGLSLPLYASRKLEHLSGPHPERKMQEDILQEIAAAGITTNNPSVVICDDNPNEQRLYSEFLFYRSLFQSFGWKCEIRDVRDLPDVVDWIYNRHTDFFLHESISQVLRKKYESNTSCISPNPNEYLYLADKQRMIDWSQRSDLGEAKEVLLFCEDLNATNAEEIWSRRKTLFFKPKNSFGSKQSYKGASVSHRLFEELISQNMIAQEYVAAPEVTFPESEDLGAFKYDLRVYVDRNTIRGAVARVYQGQVTNTRTPYGGFAPVIWTE